ncbi:cysteine desulfurase IscS [Anseongella ginsenosidimutans]|uniref:cysteine desulfurase n=1 Tax=Anseongella ginsenosidimutans TaxID=496056 RepID=A0A4R3KPY9_9SPHI|nr:aminotransferase class V-fold PLP-dependent enzyme [Anseongella ginsenosidimutans]QEC52700.1 aminotransferase class V-fold PLP-dependent enzyme [Anseongella ginsenosidimutans]TCS85448.1 cysteine desulfurase IscS [Anseongella ginsenosidimutans]
MPKLPIYLDNNATTPTDPRVLDVMLPYFTEKFGNAASRHHAFGWTAEDAVDLAREQAASLIGASPEELIFTSGATESVNMALKGVFEAYRSKGNHIITLATEHSCVLDTCRYIERSGGKVTYLPVQPDGLLNIEMLRAAITAETILISVMYANNETGVIQPMEDIGRIAGEKSIIFHTDATQGAGKIPLNVDTGGIGLLSFSAHKLYGPKGAGALFVRRKNPRVRLTPLIEGGGHEKGLRSGTLNVPGIVGFGKACEVCLTQMEKDGQKLSLLRDKLESGLLEIPGTALNGNTHNRLPHVSNIRFAGLKGDLLMSAMPDLAISSGSACTSASPEPSHVLTAMGLSEEEARSSLRFSLGRFTEETDIDFAVNICRNAIESLRDSTKHS